MGIVDIIEDMAQTGHAPDEGCSLFGIGNDEKILRLQETYLKKRFSRGRSAEKFVVGPFGSGKSHLLNHLIEVARNQGCVTAKVKLNKNIDVTSNYYIFKELAQEIKAPNFKKGMKSLLLACADKVKSNAFEKYKSEETANEMLGFWISGLDDFDFELDIFGRVTKQAFDAHQKGNTEKFDYASRWLSGEFNNKEINKVLNVSRVSKSEQNLITKRILLSLYQLIKKSGFTGTVVEFDESEQGFPISSKKKGQLFSLFQSDINSISELKNGSVLVIYAITPDIVEEMMEFPALQQRIQDPLPNMGFENGNTLAPIIYLTRPNECTRKDIVDELTNIGKKLTELLYSEAESEVTVPKYEVISRIEEIAIKISNIDLSTSNRRAMVKATCATLIYLYNNDVLNDFDLKQFTEEEEDDEEA
jgi:hypothetical protein